jgi:hypothetical protein
MARPNHEPARRRPARDRRAHYLAVATAVVFVLGCVALIVGTLIGNLWLLIAPPIVVTTMGVWAVASYMTEP